jgi:hypothetical protein
MATVSRHNAGVHIFLAVCVGIAAGLLAMVCFFLLFQLDPVQRPDRPYREWTVRLKYAQSLSVSPFAVLAIVTFEWTEPDPLFRTP